MKHSLALLVLALALAACTRGPGAPIGSATTDTAQSSTSSAQTAPAAAAAAPAAAGASAAAPLSPGDLTAAAKTQQEGSDSGTSSDSSEASLERVAALPAKDQLPAGQWQAGINYTVLAPAQPTDAPPGKVKVVEVFWYGCPHCYALEPYLETWLKSKPSYIDFVRVPVMWGDVHRAHARLFYTLEALGKADQLQGKVFDETQQRGDELYVAGDPKATLAEQLKFAQANGISAADFLSAYNSFGVQANLQKADELGRRYKIDAVPTIVIDGKYVSDVGRAGSDAKLIQLINDLAASDKHRSG